MGAPFVDLPQPIGVAAAATGRSAGLFVEQFHQVDERAVIVFRSIDTLRTPQTETVAPAESSLRADSDQVRAHLAAIGAPVVGDALYGGRPDVDLERLFLHACSLELVHPRTLRRLKIQSPLPPALAQLLARIGIRPAD